MKSNNQTVYPVPRSMVETEASNSVGITGIVARGDCEDHARKILQRLQQVGTGRQLLTVRCLRTTEDKLSRDSVTGYHHGEGYRVTASADGQFADLEFVTPRGLRYGLSTVTQLVRNSAWRSGLEMVDAPRFPVRGVIEGFFGPPWSPAKRREILDLMARHKMNSYFYAPKDDVYHRRSWRELYPQAELAALQESVVTAAGLDMDFWYTIGPGLSIAYSNEQDIIALEQKLLQLSELGITCFGLLYDDIPTELQHDSDRATYSDLAEAQAAMTHRVHQTLSDHIPGLRLAVCPTQYRGTGTEPYITRLGHLLDPRIEMFWTGPEICSRELTLKDAATLERTISRPVLYWDNYPVNDCGMANELHIGPYRGRDPHLFRASIGLVANGMEYAESSKIPLLTVADYLWNPEKYDPEQSWDYALRTVLGESQWEAFRIFADNSRYSALTSTDSPYLREQLDRVRFLTIQGRKPEALDVLRRTVDHLESACPLFDAGLENADLGREIEPWVAKYRKGVALVKGRIDLETAGTKEAKAAFEQLVEDFRADRTSLFAGILKLLSPSD